MVAITDISGGGVVALASRGGQKQRGSVVATVTSVVFRSGGPCSDISDGWSVAAVVRSSGGQWRRWSVTAVVIGCDSSDGGQ